MSPEYSLRLKVELPSKRKATELAESLSNFAGVGSIEVTSLPRSRYNPPELVELVRIHRQTMTPSETAIALDISPSTVRWISGYLTKKGEIPRLRKAKRTMEELIEFDGRVKPLYEQGLSLKEIASVLDYNLNGVTESLKRLASKDEIKRDRNNRIKNKFIPLPNGS